VSKRRAVPHGADKQARQHFLENDGGQAGCQCRLACRRREIFCDGKTSNNQRKTTVKNVFEIISIIFSYLLSHPLA
jgi:hypothetical protein